MPNTLRFLSTRAFILQVVLAFILVTAAHAQPVFTKAFSPSTIGPGSTTMLAFTIDNTSGGPVTDLAFTDVLPGGMTIADPSGATTDCGPGILTAPDGGGTISLTGGTVGGSSTCTVSVNIVGTSTALNTSGDLTSSAGNSGPASATLSVDPTRPGFSKSFSPDPISFGGISTLTFTIDNTSGGPTAFLDFTDLLPPGMEIASPANASTDCGVPPIFPTLIADPGTSIISMNVSGILPTLPAMTAGSTCTVTVDVTTTTPGTFDNVTGELTSDSGSSGFATDRLTVGLSTLVKAFTDDPVAPGGTVTLEFTLTNLSRTLTADNFAFTDTLSNVLTGLVATGLPASECGGTLSGTSILSFTGGGSLAPGASCTFSVSLSVPGGATPGTYPNTTSDVSFDLGGSPTTDGPATDNLVVAPVPVFTKEFTDDPVVAGGTVTLRFTITNTSPTDPATDITFIDELTTFLPSPLSVTLPAMPCSTGSAISVVSLGGSDQGLELTGGGLAPAGSPGDSCTFDVLVDIPLGFPNGIYPNVTTPITATIGGVTVEGPPATDDLSVVAPPVLTKVFTDDPVVPGGTVTLEFTLTHSPDAPGDATSIAFTDDLNAVLTGLSSTGLPATVCNGGTLAESPPGVLDFSGGSLTPGALCTFSVSLTVPPTAPSGSFTNTTSSVTADVDGTPTTGSPASDDLLVSALSFTKAFTDDPVAPGDPVTLEFTFTLDAAAPPATITLFTDNLSAVLSGLAATGPPTVNTCGGTLSGTTFLIYVGGSLAPGASCTITVPLLVPIGATPSIYPNVTSSLTATIGGSPIVLPPATDLLTVAVDPPPAFSKNFAPDPITLGGTSTLTFTIDNTGSATDATSLDFTDTLPVEIEIATPSNAATTCTGGTLTAPDGGGVITYTGGGSVAAGASCTVTVDVTSNTLGTHVNVSGDLTSSLGNSGAATDDLEVIGVPEIIATKVDSLLDADAIVNPGDTLLYTVVLTNIGTRSASSVTFTDFVDSNTTLDCTTTPPTTTQGTV
ncbi:MAG: hypothetical protein ACE5G0_11520, partial [Rhodothermales bacterium]